MTDIASGRAKMLQAKIIKSIIRAHDIDTLSQGGIRHIFRDLLDDPTIKMALVDAKLPEITQDHKRWMREKEEEVMYAGIDFKTTTNVPDGYVGVLHPDGRTEVIKIGEESLNKQS